MKRLSLLFTVVLMLAPLTAFGHSHSLRFGRLLKPGQQCRGPQRGPSNPPASHKSPKRKRPSKRGGGGHPARSVHRISLKLLQKRLPCLAGRVEAGKTANGIRFVSCPLDPSKSKAEIAVYGPFDDIHTIMLTGFPHGSLEDIKSDVKVISRAIVAVCASGQATDIESWILDALKASASGPPAPPPKAGEIGFSLEEGIRCTPRQRTVGGLPVYLNAASEHGVGQKHVIAVTIGRDIPHS